MTAIEDPTTPPVTALADPSRMLLEAVMAISSDLDLRSVLARIVEAGTALTGATYGALGVLAPDNTLGEFVTTGLTGTQRARIGSEPHGRGILGLLITDARPLRLSDLSRHEASFGFPPGHPPMTSFLGVPVHIRGTVFGNLYLTEKEGGGDFTDDDERLVVALANAAGLVIENARAYGLSERRRQWLEAAATLTDDLQPPVEWELALQQITTTALRVGRAWATAVVSPAPESAVLTVACEPADVAIVLEAVESAVHSLKEGPVIDPVDVTLGAVTATVVPLRARLGDGGTLVALFGPAEQRHRDLDDRELLISFADHAALALDRAMAVDDREKLAVLSDRERIARDLHDVVIQRLFAVGMQLQAASLRGGGDIRERLLSAVTDIDGTIRDIRTTIFDLQTQGADTLRGDLQTLARDYVTALGFSPTVRTSGPVDTAVSESVRDQLLPVLREALSNVARHADASRVEIEVSVAGGDLVLVVIDDGVGIEPGAVHSSGLRNARDRARALGGDLELSDARPRGLHLRWRVPLLTGDGQD